MDSSCGRPATRPSMTDFSTPCHSILHIYSLLSWHANFLYSASGTWFPSNLNLHTMCPMSACSGIVGVHERFCLHNICLPSATSYSFITLVVLPLDFTSIISRCWNFVCLIVSKLSSFSVAVSSLTKFNSNGDFDNTLQATNGIYKNMLVWHWQTQMHMPLSDPDDCRHSPVESSNWDFYFAAFKAEHLVCQW